MRQGIHKFEHLAMSTTFELMLADSDKQMAQSAAYAVFRKVDALEGIISRFLDASEVAMISRLKPGETFCVAPELMELLLISTQLCAATNGAFDVSVGGVMDVLREVGNRWKGLTDEERSSALATAGMSRLILDPDNNLVAVKPDALGRETPLELDFGAIGKGYALDLAAELLQQDWDYSDFLIHAGTSTVLVKGSMGDGEPGWPIGVGGEWRERAGLHNVRLTDGSISGSGFEVKGAHVVDVRRGVAAARHAASWSYAPSAALSDGLATAALGLSSSEVTHACNELGGCGVLLAREQPLWLDRLRRPVRQYGVFPLVYTDRN